MLVQHTDLRFPHAVHPTTSIVDRDNTGNVRGEYFAHRVITIDLTGRQQALHSPLEHSTIDGRSRKPMEINENQ